MSLWTEADLTALRQMISAGESYAEIGLVVGRSAPATLHMARRLGLRLDPAVISQRRAQTMAAINRLPAQRKRAGERLARRHADRMSWCPSEFRADYNFLRHNKCLSAAEARELVEKDMAVRGRRIVSRIGRDMLAKHERQKREAY